MRIARRLAGIVSLLAAGAAADAQSIAGTENHAVLAHGTPAGGGRASNFVSALASSTIAQVATGPVATSPSYALEAGVSWMVPQISGNEPIVFGADPSTSTKDGGKLARIFGYNFQAPGAGSLTVLFGGQAATGTFVLSNLQATTVTPGQVTSLGNPPPEAPIVVATGNGLNAAPDSPLRPSFVYEPALFATDHAVVGQQLHLHFYSEPGDTFTLVFGQTIPGFGAPVPGIQGSVEVVINPQALVGFAPLPNGHFEYTINVPDDPSLINAMISFQGLSLTTLVPLSGAFSNALTITIQ